MGVPSPTTLPSTKAPENRLDSWKEIAAYFNRDVKTVQRWEKREGMPVHRHLHDRTGSVYAFRADLDAWARSRQLRAAQENAYNAGSLDAAPAQPQLVIPAPQTRWRLLLLLVTAGTVLAIGASLWLQRTEYFWWNPIAEARFQTITDLDGVEQAAAVSRDGHFVAFLSDRDRQVDVFVTQVGSGQFHNLTRGSLPGLANPSLRSLGFSPDGTFVTFWVRKHDGSSTGDISIWAVPTLGGQPGPYLQGAAELDWSHDGSRIAYHTPGPGDPLFVSEAGEHRESGPIFKSPAGIHAHFPLWAPTMPSSTLSRVTCQTNWTSGASLQTAEPLNGSLRMAGS